MRYSGIVPALAVITQFELELGTPNPPGRSYGILVTGKLD